MSWSCGENSEELMGLRGVYLMAVHKWCSLMIRESLLLRLEYLHLKIPVWVPLRQIYLAQVTYFQWMLSIEHILWLLFASGKPPTNSTSDSQWNDSHDDKKQCGDPLWGSRGGMHVRSRPWIVWHCNSTRPTVSAPGEMQNTGIC